MSARRRVQQTLSKDIRAWLKQRGRTIKQTMALQDRGDDVRVSVQKAAYEEYAELPDTVEQWYDPEQHVLIMPLPEPDDADNDQTDLREHTGFRKQNGEGE